VIPALRLPPGSFPWLLDHDLRLSHRRFASMFAGMSTTVKAVVLLHAVVIFHLLAWPVARWIGALESADRTGFLLLMAGGILFILPWMIAQSLTSATRALYARGDLDLLLSSPVSARSVLASRAFVIVMETVGSVLVFLSPLINMCALSGRPQWLAVYPTVLAGGFLAAALGIGMAVGLFTLVGPRRTRLFSQILATFIGAIFLLGLQALSVVGPEVRQGLIAALETARPGEAMNTASALWLPVWAAMGDVAALIQWVVLSLAAFALAASTLGPKFAISVVLSSSGTSSGSASRSARMPGSGRMPLRFKTALGTAIRFKEWRLLRRDPWLSSQLALQIVYTLPVAVVLMRNQGPDGNMALAIAPALVVIASQLSASLAWLAVSGEEAREFLATAPVSQTVQQQRKLEAIAIPIAAILALPLLGVGLISPWIASVALFFCACAATSTALLNLWHPISGRRQDIMRRHSQSKLIGIMEHLFSLLWVLAMMMTLFGSKVALLPAAIALGLLACNKRWSAMTMEAALRQAAPALRPPGRLQHA
jgi:ABC-2 type transport system permease protein